MRRIILCYNGQTNNLKMRDTMEYTTWRHIFKLDPAKELSDEALERIAESGTDGIIVGGSDGVTLDNVLHLLARIRRYSVDVALEVSTIDSVTPGFDYYFIPTVLNTDNERYIKGLHLEALEAYGHLMTQEQLITEGYCILNPHCKAAKLTEANADLTLDEVVAHAQLAEHIFHLPIFYLEYSGTYGDIDVVREVAETLEETDFVYGGGIDSAEKAAEVARYADSVVVGNVIYEDLKAALQTVKAVQKTEKY